MSPNGFWRDVPTLVQPTGGKEKGQRRSFENGSRRNLGNHWDFSPSTAPYVEGFFSFLFFFGRPLVITLKCIFDIGRQRAADQSLIFRHIPTNPPPTILVPTLGLHTNTVSFPLPSSGGGTTLSSELTSDASRAGFPVPLSATITFSSTASCALDL